MAVIQINTDRLEHQPLSDDASRDLDHGRPILLSGCPLLIRLLRRPRRGTGEGWPAATIVLENISSEEKTQKAHRAACLSPRDNPSDTRGERNPAIETDQRGIPRRRNCAQKGVGPHIR